MKTTILSALLSLTLISNVAFAAPVATTQYTGQSFIEFTYFASGWDKEADSDGGCHLIPSIIFGVLTLGILPMSVCPSSELEKSINTQVKLKATLNEISNGRATIKLTSETLKNCAAFSSTIFAEEDGFGNYDLYGNKESWTNGVKLGSAVKSSNSLEITFTEDVSISTLGKKGNACIYKLGKNVEIEFSSEEKK